MSDKLRATVTTLAFIVVSLGLMYAGAALEGAHAARGQLLEPATDHPAHVRVTYVEHTHRGYVVELNTGAVWRLPRCAVEDAQRCVWDAARRGNGRGRSFVAMRDTRPGPREHVTRYRISPRMMRDAYREVSA